MSDQPVRSAEGEPWWPEFVAAYGKVPLRELARRFQTNSRRLRRAVQRSGLSAEPESLREVVERLGTCPDIVLARELKLTTETVAGARRRRRIPAFDPALVERPKPEPRKKESPPPAPKAHPPRESKPPPSERWAERKARYRPEPNDVVVVRRRAGPDGSGSPQPGSPNTFQRENRSQTDSAPSEDAGASRADAQPRRRRIVSKPSDRDESSEPEPAAPIVRRLPRLKPTAAASEVRYVDAAAMSELVEDLKSTIKEPPPRPPAPEITRPSPSAFRPTPPEPQPVRAPLPAPVQPLSKPPERPPAPANGASPLLQSAGEQIWLASIRQGQSLKELVICASSLVSAAEIASQHGQIERLGPAPAL